MCFRLSRKGARLLGGVALVVFLALALVPVGALWVRVPAALALAACVLGYFELYTFFARWGVSRGAFFSHSGLLFTGERHIPLEDVTALRVVQTPLGRPLGLCYLTVYAAGSLVSLPCVRREDAETLRLLWSGAGRPEPEEPSAPKTPLPPQDGGRT